MALRRQRDQTRSSRTPTLVACLLVATVVLGAVLRTAYLGSQVVTGDEVHAILFSKGHSLATIFTEFYNSNNSMLTSAWCRLLLTTIGLEEWGVRSLGFVPGILLLVVVARASAAFLAAPERVLLGLVLACSPVLIFWSREARPYSAISLLGVVSILCLVRFAQERRPRWLAATVACQLGLIYLSMTTLPFVGALAAGAVVWALLGSGPPGARIREAVVVAGPSLLALALASLLLVPAIPSLLRLFSIKGGGGDPAGFETIVRSIQLLYGFPAAEAYSALGFLMIVPVALALTGLARFWRAFPRAGAAAVLVLGLPALFFVLVQLKLIDRPRVFVRYQAAVAPLWIALAVCGFGALRSLLQRHSRRLGAAALAAAFGLVSLLVVTGPLASGMPPRFPFGLITSRLYLRKLPWSSFRPELIPVFYRELTDEDAEIIVEWPASSYSRNLISGYQQLHRKRVIRVHPLEIDDYGLAFRTFHFGLASLSERVAWRGYIVVHRNPREERRFVTSGRRSLRDEGAPEEPDARAAVERCRMLFGPAIYEDEWIVVFRKVAGA